MYWDIEKRCGVIKADRTWTTEPRRYSETWQWFTNCADGLLEAAVVISECTFEWLTVVIDASL